MNEFYESIIKEIKSYKRYGTEFSMMDEFYNSDNDEFSFSGNDYHNGLNTQDIIYKGVIVGTLYEREQNFLVPVICTAVTWDLDYLDKKIDGSAEWKYNGIWLQERNFPTMKDFEKYVINNFERIVDINNSAD